jgi:hypothetical protein
VTEPTREEVRERLEALRASAGEADEPEQAPTQIDLPLLQVSLANVRIGVGQSPDGSKLLVIGPFALELQVPLGQHVAGEIGAALTGGVHVAGVELDLGTLGVDRAAIAEAARTALEREGKGPRRR